MFDRSGRKATWAAALAFLNIGFMGGRTRSTVPLPRFRGRLPSAFQALERSSYDARVGKIISQVPSTTYLFSKLWFATRDLSASYYVD